MNKNKYKERTSIPTSIIPHNKSHIIVPSFDLPKVAHPLMLRNMAYRIIFRYAASNGDTYLISQIFISNGSQRVKFNNLDFYIQDLWSEAFQSEYTANVVFQPVADIDAFPKNVSNFWIERSSKKRMPK